MSASGTAILSGPLAAPPAGRGAVAAAQPIRVLLVLTCTAGGAGLHGLYLARGLQREGFYVRVAYGPGYPLDASFDRLDPPPVKIAASRSLSPASNARALAQVYRLMRRERFDVVCMGQSVAGVIGRVAAAAAGVPRRVMVIHAYASQSSPSPVGRWAFGRVERAMDRLTTCYVAVSDATRRFGVERRIIDSAKARVIYNGVPPVETDAGSIAAVRAELGVRADEPLVATAGRFEPQKGLMDFLEAAALVRRRVPGARFLLLGDGPLEAALRTRAAQLGLDAAVVFGGWRPDAPRVLAAADVFALCSHWEAAPLVLGEVMSAGRPAVATDVGGVSELVADGETGFVVPARQPGLVADRVTRLLDDPALAGRMGRAGRLRYEARFTLEAMVARYAEVLRQHVRPRDH